MDKIDPKFTAIATATGGRNGHTATDDGMVSVDLSVPKAMGGPGKPNTATPEQLFAAGYAACFMGALTRAFANAKMTIPADVSIDSEVSLLPQGDVFNIGVTLNVNLPGVDHDKGVELVHAAHQICPYSNATRGNVDVQLVVR